MGPDRQVDLSKIRKTFLYNNVNLKIYGDGKNLVDCTNLNLQSYSSIVMKSHGNFHKGKARAMVCKETDYTDQVLNLVAKNKPQNFELFSCHSVAAISVDLLLPKSSTIITSTDESKNELVEINTYNLLTLSKVKTENPFIKFANYIYLAVDQVKFAIQTDIDLKSYKSDFNKLTKYSTDEIRKWQGTQLINFISWVKSIKNSVTDLRRYDEIEEFIKEFTDYKKSALELSKEYSIEIYKNHLLLKAIKEGGDMKLIENLLSSDIDINFNYEKTALYFAAIQGHNEIVQMIIKAGADLNTKINSDGSTALMAAAVGGYADVVQNLIEAGSDLNIKNNDGFTALIVASTEGHIDVVQKFIEAGADLNIKNNYGLTPLIAAATNGHIDVVQKFIEAGADLNIKNNYGFTALIKASTEGHVDVVEKLIEAGASLNIKNNNGYTALIQAAAEGHTEILKKLAQTADLNIKNKYKLTALITAVRKGNAEMVQTLIKAGADLKDPSFLEAAVEDNNFDIVKTVLSCGYNKVDDYTFSIASQKIKTRLNKFNGDPIKYILKTNKLAENAERAFHIFKTYSNYDMGLSDKIHRAEECLAA